MNYRKAFEKVQESMTNIVPGGFEEIVITDEYYFMKGDNFDLHVYEIL